MSDPMKYRTKEEFEKAKLRDPIELYKSRLLGSKILTEAQLESMEEEISAEVSEALQQADSDPHPALEERFDDILAETYPYEPE
jgi:pyruvate dehydrogenase E1 component alpha subunit